MSAIRFTHRKRPPPPTSFMSAENGLQIPNFIPGQCVCKVCGSKQLNYVPYLDDAKCIDCLNYQNEELNLN